MIFSNSRDTLPTKNEDEEPFFKTPPSRFSAACPSHAKNVDKKRDFKACPLEIFSCLRYFEATALRAYAAYSAYVRKARARWMPKYPSR